MENKKMLELALKEKLELLNKELEEKQQELDNFELDESEYEDAFCEMLDELYNPMFGFYPSRILAECDPIQYDMALSEYVDSIDVSDNSEYQQIESEIEELEDEIAELEDEIAELEDEIAELEDEIAELE